LLAFFVVAVAIVMSALPSIADRIGRGAGVGPAKFRWPTKIDLLHNQLAVAYKAGLLLTHK
jgi:hypothetical protein